MSKHVVTLELDEILERLSIQELTDLICEITGNITDEPARAKIAETAIKTLVNDVELIKLKNLCTNELQENKIRFNK